MDGPCTRPSEFSEITADEASRIVIQAPAKHCALDPAPTWLIKHLLPLLANTLANIRNSTFQEGLFPDILKQLLRKVVRPCLKNPGLNTNDLSSYRPISNLCFVSKVVERAVVARLTAHTELQRLFPCCQSAYIRKQHSTETADVVHDEIVKSVGSGDVCALLLLDLGAAFATVDHHTPLQVLASRFGLADRALHWCESYLSL